LGVYQGAWDAEPGDVLANDRGLSGGVRVPVGIGIVVPIDRVIKVIERSDDFKQLRERIRQEDEAKTTDWQKFTIAIDANFLSPTPL